MTRESTILFQSKDVLVRAFLSDRRDRVVVSFDSFTDNPSLARAGFGESFLTQRDIDCILILTRSNLWYQEPEIPEAIRAIAAVTAGYHRVFTYGSSMGGYACIRHAHALGATAIAFAPQYSVDPERVPEETRWPQARRIAFQPAERHPVPPPEGAFIFYDPCDRLDRLHARRIAGDIASTLIPIAHGGHVVIAFLSEAGLLVPGVLALLDGEFDPATFIAEARARRKTVAKYYEVLSFRLRDTHPGWSIALARHAVSLSPEAGHISQLANLLREQGRHQEAEPWARRAVALDPENLNYRYCLAAVLMGRGERHESLALALFLVAAVPDRQDYHRLLAGIHRLRGAFPQAFRSRLAAFRLTPRHSPARRRAARILVMDALRALPLLGGAIGGLGQWLDRHPSLAAPSLFQRARVRGRNRSRKENRPAR